MLLKIYFTLWALLLTAVGIMLVSGTFTMMAAVVVGFISFGMTFMGMISVLPSAVVHSPAAGPEPISLKPKVQARAVETQPAFTVLKSA